ncbi:MAG: C40 family peptidase [Candidatus Sumerlaeaceae bacterium]|nr:C40 family peptidase [Candidatus Sumerlaeaceae bacterium]
MSLYYPRNIVLCLIAVSLFAAAPSVLAQPAGSQPTQESTRMSDAASTNTDFLSDPDFRQLSREERRRRGQASYIARFEPTGKPSVEKLNDYMEKFVEINVFDPRLFVCKLTAERVPDTTGSVILRGEVSAPQFKSGIENTLKRLGFNVDKNEIALLPSPDLVAPYAVSTTSAATLRKEPRRNAEQVNSVPIGGGIRLLRAARAEDVTTTATGRGNRGGGRMGRRQPEDNTTPADWFLAQTPEGYTGFVLNDEIRLLPEFVQPDAILLVPTIIKHDDQALTIPMGALLHAGKEKTPRDQRTAEQQMLAFRLPLGKTNVTLSLPAANVRQFHPVFTAEQIEALVKPFDGTTYVWGGTTNDGIDCSGFSQFVYKSRGVFLPRDAVEQAIVGRIVAWGTDVEKYVQPGDLIFFLSDTGRVSHVAVSLGGDKIVHSSHDRVKYGTIADQEDNESPSLRTRAVFARRVF